MGGGRHPCLLKLNAVVIKNKKLNSKHNMNIYCSSCGYIIDSNELN